MKTIKNFILALVAWAMMSVSALAVDIIVVSHGQANDPFWSVAKNGVDAGCKDMGVLVNILHLLLLTWWKWQN